MTASYHKLDVLDGNNNIPSEAGPNFRSSNRFEGKQEMVWRQGVGEGDKYLKKNANLNESIIIKIRKRQRKRRKRWRVENKKEILGEEEQQDEGEEMEKSEM